MTPTISALADVSEPAAQKQPEPGYEALEDLLAGLAGTARRTRSRRQRVLAVTFLADIAILFAIIAAFSFGYTENPRPAAHLSLLSAIIIPAFLAIALNNGAYRINSEGPRYLAVWRSIIALLYASAGVFLFVVLAKTDPRVSRFILSGVIVTSATALYLSRSLLNSWATRYLERRPFATLCVYDRVPMTEDPGFTRISAQRFNLSANASDPVMIERLAQVSNNFDRLVIHCRPEDRMEWAFVLKSVSIPAEMAVPEIHALSPVSIHQRGGKTCLMISSGPLEWHQRLVKRAFDLAVVIAAMPLLLPLMIVVSILIKLDSKGPVFFRQPRIGLNNQPFQIMKFRSMRTDLLDLDGKQSTERDDPRITRLGSFLRRSSLDEIPQVINVLKGEMSIVGPRPHARLSRAGELLFWEVDNAYWHRHVVKPGMTGLAQVRGHRGNTFHEDHLRDRLNADLEYVASWSLIRDISIILQTFRILRHENAF